MIQILMYVHHFQVPQIAAWSCDPDFLDKRKSVKYCVHQSNPVAVRTDSFTDQPPNLIQGELYLIYSWCIFQGFLVIYFF